MFCFLFLIVFLSLFSFFLFLKISCCTVFCWSSRVDGPPLVIALIPVLNINNIKNIQIFFLYLKNIFLLKLSCGWSSSGYFPHSRFNVKYRHSLSSLYSICSCISRDTNHFLLLKMSFWLWGVTLTSLFPSSPPNFPSCQNSISLIMFAILLLNILTDHSKIKYRSFKCVSISWIHIVESVS